MRADGKRLRNTDPMYTVASYVMSKRVDSMNMVTLDIPYDPIQEYLNKNVYGEYALAGSLFLDSRCDRTFQGSYQLVYGHHMEKHRMFGDLDLYLDPQFFESHTTGTLMVPGRTYSLQILASMRTEESDHFIFDPEHCLSEPESFRQEILSKSEYIHERLWQEWEQEPEKYSVLALSTCSSEKEEERIVVFAVYKSGE